MKTLLEIIKNKELVEELQLSALEDIRNLYRLMSTYSLDKHHKFVEKSQEHLMLKYTHNYIKRKFNLGERQIENYILDKK